MKRTHRYGLSTLVVAAAAVFAACGVADDGSDVRSAPTTTASDPVTDDMSDDMTDDMTTATTGPQSDDADPDDSIDPAPPPPTTTPDATPDSESVLVEAAVADLATTEARDPDDIQFVSFERVNWRDGSLGCPEPGYSYTQAIVRGYRIVLSLDGSIVEYHGAAGGPPLFCADPQDPAPGNDRSDA